METAVTSAASFTVPASRLSVQLGDVIVLDALTHAGNLNLDPSISPRFTFVKGDIRDGALAANSSPRTSPTRWSDFAADVVDRSIGRRRSSAPTSAAQTLLDAVQIHLKTLPRVSTDEVYSAV
jgi:dTDP-glucose 4,6-dehydratase